MKIVARKRTSESDSEAWTTPRTARLRPSPPSPEIQADGVNRVCFWTRTSSTGSPMTHRGFFLQRRHLALQIMCNVIPNP